MAILGLKEEFKASCHCREDIKEYRYTIEITFKGDIVHGFIEGIDYSVIKKRLASVISELNEAYLNSIVGRSTKENITQYLLYQIKELGVHSITLHEGDQYVTIYGSEFDYERYPTLLLFNKGHNHLRRGELNLAIKDFDLTIINDPDFAMAYNMRGRCYKYKGNFDKAKDDYQEAIRIDPEYGEAYRNLGNAYLELGKYDEMMEAFNKAINLMPDSALAFNNRGFALQKKGTFERAIEDHNKAISLDPHYAEAYNDRANAYSHIGKTELAKSDNEKANELVHKGTDTYHNKVFY